MASIYKVLGQGKDADTAPVDLYTVPAATQAVISSISICNADSSSHTFDILIRPAGAASAAVHRLAFLAPIAPNDSIILTVGVTLDATDVVTVEASDDEVVFHAYGSEVS